MPVQDCGIGQVPAVGREDKPADVIVSGTFLVVTDDEGPEGRPFPLYAVGDALATGRQHQEPDILVHRSFLSVQDDTTALLVGPDVGPLLPVLAQLHVGGPGQWAPQVFDDALDESLARLLGLRPYGGTGQETQQQGWDCPNMFHDDSLT